MKKFSVTLALLAGFCAHAAPTSVSLDGAWTLDFWPQPQVAAMTPEAVEALEYQTIPCTVPGNVELDLYAAGLVPQPEIGSNVHLLRPYEGYQWRYSREFEAPEVGEDESVVLHFGGIDCYAEVYVNGVNAGGADNMLIPHDFTVTDLLRPGLNRLEVIIRSSVEEARSHIVPTLSNNWHRPETVYTRRAPHSYGWDIMPRLVSAGLWKSVSLEVLPAVHIRDAHWMTASVDVAGRRADVYLDYTLALPVKYQDSLRISVCLSRNGRTVLDKSERVAMHSRRLKFSLEDVEFWWPRGFGEPALYDALVRVYDRDGRELDRDCRKMGIRTVRLEHTEVLDADGQGQFRFVVNGEPVFIHGSNWTPMDALHSRDPQWLDRTVALAVDLNCNMLRCWGGNVYEDDRFYELCDEAGIMIWQDFTFGCSFYPQNIDFQRQLEKEIASVVTRLRSHPSIALWSGNNENDEELADKNFRTFRPDPNRDVVSRVTIPGVLYELDPTRDYLPSSPYWSPEFVKEHYAEDLHLPERHLWGPRGYYKDPFYTTQAKCLFASETGYHGCPELGSLERMFPASSVYPWTGEGEFHWNPDWITKAVTEYEEYGYYHNRNDLMVNQIRLVFGVVPTDLDAFVEASQSVQAEAMKFFVERFRGAKFAPRTGIIWWNVRDGWPIISDAVVDWYFTPKKAYWYIRNVQRDVCAMIVDAEDGSGTHPLVVVNDTLEPASGYVRVTDVESGRTVWKGRYAVEANGRLVLASLPAAKGQGVWKISYNVGGDDYENHYLYGEPPFDLETYADWMKNINVK